MATVTQPPRETDFAILERILADENGQMPNELAHYILNAGFSESDKARMHDLVTRNQDDALTPAKKEEMHAFGRAGDMLSILKSKARRTLGIKLETRFVS